MRVISFLMNDIDFKLREVKWQDEEKRLRDIRTIVFIEEQHVPEVLEWDEYDETSVHILVEYNGEAIATGRLLETGQIGRMAVIKKYRSKGIGSEIIKKLMLIAEKEGMQLLFLNAQVDAVLFYKKFGFKEEGEVFDDAGIPHLRMVRDKL